ncbi:alpha-N-arabinofuranosidase [Altererythrobacter lauratis]|uniref:non-reducing end alpha-L-arabinofuranosidase n=1 Tax=Alteraurantiacibacter lauratis TaxID=2054627 RepID=A0ABV7ECJ6_9SPHN
MRSATRRWKAVVTACLAPVLALMASPAPLTAQEATGTIRADTPGPVYSRRIFTQFAEHLGYGIYGGLYVGEDSPIPNVNGFRSDVIGALRELRVPVLRWPGGCFADEYNWREGIGPKADRPVKINTHWGGVEEPNAVGTHEFFELARQLGAEAFISGNVGNGTPRESAEWVEYITSPAGSLAQMRAENGREEPWTLEFFGIGNELWGCGGNMRAEYAADVTRRFSTFIKAPAGTKITKIAAGANSGDTEWTRVFMDVARDHIDGLSLHYYSIAGGWPPSISATDFAEEGWAHQLSATWQMDRLLAEHTAVMDEYDPEKRVFLAVDEWGAWYAPDPGTNPGFLQQGNTLRDAVLAGINLNIFARYADRVRLTAIAQMVNVLQAMVITDGPQMVRTPTFHVFAMYVPFQDGTVLPLDLNTPDYTFGPYTMPAVSAAAVRGTDGHVYVALTNGDPNRAIPVSLSLAGVTAHSVSGQVLTGDAVNARNSFADPDAVAPAPFGGARLAEGRLEVTMPAKSVVMLKLD